MKRLSTVCLAAAALSLLAAAGKLYAQLTIPDSADPTPSAIELVHADAARSGYDPVTIDLPLSTVWRLSGDAHKSNPSSMVAENGIVYYGSGTDLVAVRLADGQKQWSVSLPSDGRLLSTPAIAGGYLFFGTTSGTFYKVSRTDGSIAWSYKTGGSIVSSPVVAGGLVYFGSQDTNCYALDADTGKVTWQYAANAPVNAPPSVGAGLAVFTSSDYNVYSFTASSGRLGWSLQLPDDPSIGPAAISGSSLTVGAGQWLYSFTVRSGALRWKARFDDNVVSSPTIGPDAVYAATADGNIYGLSDRGQIRWKTTVGASPASGILLTQNAVIVGTTKGGLYALDPSSGAILWDYAIQPDAAANVDTVRVTGQPIYVDGNLLALTDDGALTEFRHDAPDSAPPRLSAQLPKPGDIVAGTGLKFSATLVDFGSGIDPGSVQYTLDGTALPGGHYDADSNGLVTDPLKAKELDLINGTHIISVKAKDWRGNPLAQTWGFTVDRTLNPKTDDDTAPDDANPGTVPSAANTMPPPGQFGPGGGGGGGGNEPNPGQPPPPPPFNSGQ